MSLSIKNHKTNKKVSMHRRAAYSDTATRGGAMRGKAARGGMHEGMGAAMMRRGMTLWGTALAGLTMVGFVGLAMAPDIIGEKASAVTQNSEMSVGVNEVLSIRIVEPEQQAGEWVDTNVVSTDVTHGSFAHASVKVIASTNAPGGYTLSLSDADNDADLASTQILNTIPTLSESVTLTGADDPSEAFPPAKWGYNWVKDGEAANYVYMPMPLSNAAASAKQKDQTNTSGVGIYTFTLGVRVAEDTPAETYEDQVMFTLVGNPAPSAPSFFTTEYMDQFNSTICGTVSTPSASVTNVTDVNGYDYVSGGTIVPSTLVKDRRDGQIYTVRKLADGNCWMTDNLRLGKNGSVVLDSTYSNMTSGRTFTVPAANTETGFSWANQATYPFVFYRDSNPGAVSATVKPDGVTPDSPSALYNWYTATAGARDASGNSVMTNTNTPVDSVCPKNWQLPVTSSSYNINLNKSYMKLVNIYTGATENSWETAGTQAGNTNETRIIKLLSEPTSFVYSDYYDYDGTLYSRPVGLYWSSSPQSAAHAYNLYFRTYDTLRNLGPQNDYNKGHAFAVRCVVQ